MLALELRVENSLDPDQVFISLSSAGGAAHESVVRAERMCGTIEAIWGVQRATSSIYSDAGAQSAIVCTISGVRDEAKGALS